MRGGIKPCFHQHSAATAASISSPIECHPAAKNTPSLSDSGPGQGLKAAAVSEVLSGDLDTSAAAAFTS